MEDKNNFDLLTEHLAKDPLSQSLIDIYINTNDGSRLDAMKKTLLKYVGSPIQDGSDDKN